MYGFFRVGAAVPELKVADCSFNTKEILKVIQEAKEKNIRALVFPELCISSYTCGDLFLQRTLIESCEKSLSDIAKQTSDIDMYIILGLPVEMDCRTFNCAAVLYKGKILSLIPKTYIPNYGEFYEKRWFASANEAVSNEIVFGGQNVPVGAKILFRDKTKPEFTFGVELCEDLWCRFRLHLIMPLTELRLYLIYRQAMNLHLKTNTEENWYHSSRLLLYVVMCMLQRVWESLHRTLFSADMPLFVRMVLYYVRTNVSFTKVS